ncbi:MAG: hypothetical protein ACM3MK_08890 [Chitinophagales bacterium]
MREKSNIITKGEVVPIVPELAWNLPLELLNFDLAPPQELLADLMTDVTPVTAIMPLIEAQPSLFDLGMRL